MGYHTTNTAIM